jgi:hypothetical protein
VISRFGRFSTWLYAEKLQGISSVLADESGFLPHATHVRRSLLYPAAVSRIGQAVEARLRRDSLSPQ